MSKRSVWPYAFTLDTASLSQANQPNVVQAQQVPGESGQAPIVLRWSTRVELGFPRQPFEVFRRLRNPIPASLTKQVMPDVRTVASEQLDFNISQEDLQYIVTFSAAPASGSSITVTAVDLFGNPIPRQQVILTNTGPASFVYPGIAALRVTGNGQFGPMSSVAETAYANLPDWKRIQVVGLPVQDNEFGASYLTAKQGPETPSLDGVQAALNRLSLMTLLQRTPPATGVGDFPLLPWPVPNPAAYLDSVGAEASLIPMIGRCLETKDDKTPNGMQYLYTESVSLPGVKQANVLGAAADPSNVQLPVVGVNLMAASTDTYAATALGYGTIDVPSTAPGVASSQLFQIDPVSGDILRVSAVLDPTNALHGLVFDPVSGLLYATSENGNALFSIDPATFGATKVGTVPSPDGLVADGRGLLYIASKTGAIYSFNVSSHVVTKLTDVPGLTELALRSPGATAGSILCATSRENRQLLGIDTTNNSVTVLHATADFPDSLAFDRQGRIIYDEPGVSQLRRYDPVTNTDTLLAGPANGLNGPEDLLLSPTDASILVSNFIGGTISRTDLITSATTILAQIPFPQGLALDNSGRLFVLGQQSAINVTYDYMVVAPFVLPSTTPLTVAALSRTKPDAEAAIGLQAKKQQVGTPLSRDSAAPAAVKLFWPASAEPQGYGILTSRQPNHSEVLNSARPLAVGGFDSYIALPPRQSGP